MSELRVTARATLTAIDLGIVGPFLNFNEICKLLWHFVFRKSILHKEKPSAYFSGRADPLCS